MQIHSVSHLYAVTVPGELMRVSDTVNHMNSGIQSSLFTSEVEVDRATEDYYVLISVSS